ncbi:dihydrofolate reductase family protein [Angustibacter sp. Root456]|uniref:dihydrofolate reductase family protein n=1 Tax=Angustibacter sp. Root456 TaxID=1736539 RepID=UPI0006F67C2F|nr:dihydrofolate reductase family protein [Angustibacter sp. Root456]KQX69579.1 deaminase [Angustibacter sp. Root456]
MGRLVYNAITSLDGYTVDAEGSFAWARPDEEVHTFANELVRPLGTHLLGRRMYEVMRYWEAPPDSGDPDSAITDEFAALWQDADKVVFSRTLEQPTTRRTTVERTFDPAAVQQLVADSARDVGIGGATLATQAVRSGLVDELQQLVIPVVVGGGTRWLPDDVRLDLELTETRRFAAGVVFLRYAVRR